MLVLLSCGTAQSNQKSTPLVGGSCQYKTYSGRATILSIQRMSTNRQEKIDQFAVEFSFHPLEKIEESFAQVAGKTFLLYDNNLQYPDQKFLNKYNIKSGQVLEGYLKTIISGTCTPVLFEFSFLKQGK
jgi:hypothetical protein